MAIARYLVKLRRKYRLLPTVGAFLLCCTGVSLWTFFVDSSTSRSSGEQWVRPVPIGYLIRTPGCTLPRFDPFDPTVKRFIRRGPKRVQCPGKPNFLTIRNGVASIIPRNLEEHGVAPEDLDCFYKEIYRNTSLAIPDDHYMIGRKKRLSFDKALRKEFVLVECATKKSPDNPFHKQFLLNAFLKKSVEKRCRRVRRRTPHNLSVLMLGLDAVSHLNFDRHLPETGKFLREKLGAIELHGYNKVGENSYPNAFAFLAGLKDFEVDKAVGTGFYDRLTSRFIWHQYSSRGYRTMMFEEWVYWGYFLAFRRKGFLRPPTDYYPRHVVKLMEEQLSWVEDDLRCLGSTTETQELLDYLVNFVNVMSKRPLFAFAWLSDMTHEWFNNAAYADEPFRQLFETLHASGALNNTVLAFFSDHGIRTGDIRTTYIGRMEDNHPFAFIVFPPWFLEKNPEAARSLRVNQRRLTTPFDLHATLVELLDYPGKKRPRTAHGLSLLHEIPDERTCDDASIKRKWCSCNFQGDAAVSGTLARALANQIVSDVNRALARVTRKCAAYRLLRVVDVTLLQATPAELAKNTSDYLVDVMVSPGSVVFESTVSVSAGNVIEVNAISRCDKYSPNTYCIWGHPHERYCYCHRTVGGQV
ncbi:hypothetical protein HPB50_008004 [Hyalomma asiaticum]|uniref:Uncharacterized protein n=1 Tax=Hyalomma asiaticum TaxID=266040 RepID=A0ACB7SNP7_HYAAI|nr:hypothetical protein HPB50_008004 [Hyalomma asiaticum]